MLDIVKEYEKKIEIMLVPLGICRESLNGRSKKYADINTNAFNEIKALFIHTFVSYEEEKLNQAINNIMPTLYLIGQ